MSIQVGCLSFRQPYAGLVLDGLKTIETRWRPLLSEFENCTLAVHIAQKDWEGSEWRGVLTRAHGMTCAQIDDLLESGERFGRGVVAGLVEVGETWVCPVSLPRQEMEVLEGEALITGLEEKYLTRLSFPRWLNKPMYARGHKDVWTVDVPLDLLSPSPPTHHRSSCV